MRIRASSVSALAPFAFGLLGLAWPAAPARADDVYLRNGRTFEGVIAEVGETRVRVQIPGGVLSLPRSAVLRVEKSDTAFAEYLRRKEALERAAPHGGSPASSASWAGEWLGLARWAGDVGFEQGAREAALRAAEIDPRLPGLAPAMRRLGYEYDQGLDRWIAYADSMRRRGFVLDGGQWITREEAAERVRARDDERLRRQMAMAATRDAARAANEARDAALLHAELELYRQQQAAGAGPYPYGSGYPWGYGFGSTLLIAPGFGPHFFSHDRHPFGDRRFSTVSPQARELAGLLARPPGSLLPPSAYLAPSPADFMTHR